MLKGDYDVDSDQKGSARWLTDKEVDQLFPKCAYDELAFICSDPLV